MSALSIVVPTLNAARSLPACLTALGPGRASFPELELLVVDGGSNDGTQALATASGARVIAAPRGRGTQLAVGARAATGDWLLFLHADTVLAPGWVEAVHRHVQGAHFEGPGGERAGYFRFVLDDDAKAARRLEKIVALRCRLLALPYGDQGLLLPRGLYDRIGGFRPLPIMEDVDLVCKLGRNRLSLLEADAVTSAERYRRGGYWRRPLRNLACLSLYAIGVAPARIARLYG